MNTEVKPDPNMEVSIMMNSIDLGQQVTAYASATDAKTGVLVGNRYLGTISRHLLLTEADYKVWMELMEKMAVASLKAGGGVMTSGKHATPGELNG